MADAPRHLDPQVLERLRTGLRLIALRSLNDADAAEEVVQETLLRGMQAIAAGRFHDHGSVGAYFRGICRHVVVDRVRKSHRTTSLDALPEQADGNPSNDALQTLVSREQKQRVIRALAELPAREFECLRMSFYEGLKPGEIAKRLGEPGPRIRKRLSRALKKLRDVFSDQAGDAVGHDSDRTAKYRSGGVTSPTNEQGDRA